LELVGINDKTASIFLPRVVGSSPNIVLVIYLVVKAPSPK